MNLHLAGFEGALAYSQWPKADSRVCAPKNVTSSTCIGKEVL